MMFPIAITVPDVLGVKPSASLGSVRGQQESGSRADG